MQFGAYPQSRVTDEAIIDGLDSQSLSWKSYNYYSGTGSLYDGNMKPSDYMKYADIVFNGNKYRAVTFSKYRPRFTGDTFSSSYINQDYNGYYTGNVYYFKYEPLKWRVLDASMGLVVCDSIIDSQAYNNYILESNGEYYGDSGKNHYASDWENSSLRKWLNEDFYNTAFSKLQQDRIQKLTRENWSTNESKYDSNPTSDKITLLSYYDALNTFNSTSITKDGARRRKGTDYAKCQGVGVVSDYGGTYDWWLRSPDESCYATEVGYDGRVDNFYCNVYATHRGVVPALNLGKSTISTSSIHTGEIAAYETEVEEKLETSPAIQTVYTPLKNGEFTLGSAVDGNGYMVYGVTDYTDGFTLTSDNLVYIDCSEGKDGKVTLSYKPSKTDSATVIVVGDFGSGVEVKCVKLSEEITEPLIDFEVIEFGSYPQTEVTDATTLKNLNSLSINWNSYGYSYGTNITDSTQATTSDYMQYADIVYGGEKYRAVKMSQLRPSINYYPSSTTYSEQDDNGYDNLNKVYWFKYEPLKWIVLDSTSGLVMCKNVIDSQEFNKKIFDDKYGDSNHNYFANNYEQSSIRNWLNKDFYNIAFSSTDKTRIEEKTLSNVAYDKAQFNSGDTTDKITLLSFAEYQKIKNDYRLWQAGCSNYALCQGVSSNSGNTVADWMLRTAGTWSDVICSVSYSGTFSTSSTETFNSSMGIRPVVYLKTKNSESKPKVQGVSVGSDIKINYKKSETINYSVTADKGSKYSVSFTSSNPKVVTVDENGKVYAAKKGSATITCTVTDSNGNTVQDTCKVTVKYSFGQWLIKILLFGWIWY